MRSTKILAGLCLLVGVVVSSVALADHGHGRVYGRGGGYSHGGSHIGFGLYLGAPYMYPYSPYYYPSYPYAYYPPVIVSPQQPQVYIEQDNSQAAPQATNYWYHCDKPEGYYPYVKECPGGWEQVSPTPPR